MAVTGRQETFQVFKEALPVHEVCVLIEEHKSILRYSANVTEYSVHSARCSYSDNDQQLLVANIVYHYIVTGQVML